MRKLIALVVLAASFTLLAGETTALPANLATRHAIIFVEDGERYTETWGDAAHKNIPHTANELAPQGVIATHFTNQGQTETNPGHSTLCTGVYQHISNDGATLPAQPSMFQAYRKATGAPASATWVITAKDKLYILGDCTATGWQGKFTASTDCGAGGKGRGSGYREDAATMQSVLKILARDHPKLVIINLKDPDSKGHANDWNGYLQAIRYCDTSAAQLWQFIQKDPVYANTTALFITNDHGRHTENFKDHGCSCEGCRHLLFCALGPDFKKGVVCDTPAEQIDVAPTIAAMLHFPLPDAQGRVMTELFAAAGTPRKDKPAPPAKAPAADQETVPGRR